MVILYNCIILIYTLLIRVAAIFNNKAKYWVTGRKNIFNNIATALANNTSPIVWFHAASLGEFEQGRPVIEALKASQPNTKIFLTFFSPSGFEIRKNYTGADYIFYLPTDTSWNAKKFIKILNPWQVFFIKYEFWYNYINTLNNKNIPIYCFSAIFRPQQSFFKCYGGQYRSILYMFKHIFVQTINSKQLLEKYNIKNVTVTGDTRFDRVAQIAANTVKLSIVEKFVENSMALVAGSTWQPDEKLIIDYFNTNKPACKLIIAPHEIEISNINRIEAMLVLPAIRYSQAHDADLSKYSVLIIDNIGMLSSIYQYGTLSYIGGAFGKGLHNILEAATFGLPVVFGPNYSKFQEAVDVIERKGAFCIHNKSELENIFDTLLYNTEFRENASRVCKNYVAENIGSTDIILKTVSSLN